MAYKIAPEQDDELEKNPDKKFTDEKRKILAELDKRRTWGPRLNKTEEQLRRTLMSDKIEDETGFRPLNASEHAEYLNESKKIYEKTFTGHSDRFLRLQNRIDNVGREEE